MRARSIRWTVGVLVAALIVLDVAATLLEARGRTQATPAPLAAGTTVDRPVPDVTLRDARGRPVPLTRFRGRTLVLAPAFTRCHETCPLTTAALGRIRDAAAARGLGDRVAVAEVTVDPARDTPARLRAFRRRTGSTVPFLTGRRAEVARLWRALGVAVQPTRDDVTHTDGLFYVDPRGVVRVAVVGTPDVGRVPARLAALLSPRGRAIERRPPGPWSVDDALTDLWHVMGLPSPPVRAPSPAEARRALAGSPAPLAALHADAGRLLGGGRAAFSARVRALRGRPVVVNEWASWCPPCRSEFPLFAAASARLGRAVGFLGLNVGDGGAGARTFLRSHPVSYPSYRDDDGAIARSLARSVGLPTTLFLDPSGRVTGVHLGVYHDLDQLLADIRHETPPATR